jgi:hypothetical protein
MVTFAAVTAVGCSEKDGTVPPGDGQAAGAYRPMPPAYWVADRIEEDTAVLENTATSEIIERPVRELPDGVEEGSVLADGAAPWLDDRETATRAARLRERFEMLKSP